MAEAAESSGVYEVDTRENYHENPGTWKHEVRDQHRRASSFTVENLCRNRTENRSDERCGTDHVIEWEAEKP